MHFHLSPQRRQLWKELKGQHGIHHNGHRRSRHPQGWWNSSLGKKIFTWQIRLDSPVSPSWEGKKVHSLGQKPEAAVGSKRATKTEEKRFTALLSRMGFPAMCLVSRAGLLTTSPVLSSRPEMEGGEWCGRHKQPLGRANKHLSPEETICAGVSVLCTMMWGKTDMVLYLKPLVIKDLPAQGAFTASQQWSLISLEFL